MMSAWAGGPELNPHLIIFAVDTAAITCSLLLAVGNVVRLPRDRNAWLVTGLLVGNVCALVLGRYQYGYWIPEPYRIDVSAWEPLLNIGRNLSPGLLMLLCHSLFQEGRLPRWLLGLFAVQVLLEEPVHLLVGHGVDWRWLTEALPGSLEALFAGLAVYWTLAGWGADLVETRRRLRWIAIALIGLLMFGSVLLLRVVIPFDSALNYYASVALTVLDAAVLFGIVLALLGAHGIEQYLNPDASPAVAPVSAPAALPDDDAAELARLDQLMSGEHVYCRPGLTVRSLADLMGLPEYRLRRLIHERLGYRNFNAFLHDYRIAEACRRLRDPAQRRTPILTIALSVGYQSINTFNRGFREVMEITPSAFRAGADAAATPQAPDHAEESPRNLKHHPTS